MSFSRELHDFASGFRKGVETAATSDRAAAAREKYRPYKEDPNAPSDFPAGGSPKVGTHPGETKTDPQKTGSTEAPAPNVGGGKIDQYIYDYYRNKGLSATASAAIAGNLMRESGGDPRVLSGARTGDAGASYYVGQWNGKRLDNLNAFAKGRGNPKPTLQDQLDFVLEEMNPNSPYVDKDAAAMFPKLQEAKDLAQAVRLFQTGFERPQYPEKDFAPRLKYAQGVAEGTGYSTQPFSFGKTAAAPATDGGDGTDTGDGTDGTDSGDGGDTGDQQDTSDQQASAEGIPIPEGVPEQEQNPWAIQIAPVQPLDQQTMYGREGGVIPDMQSFQDGGMPMPYPRTNGGQSLPQGGAIPDAQYFQAGGQPSYLSAYDKFRAMQAATPTATGGGSTYTPQQVTAGAGRSYTQPWTPSAGGTPARSINLGIDYQNLGSGPTPSQLAFRAKPAAATPAAAAPAPAAVDPNMQAQIAGIYNQQQAMRYNMGALNPGAALSWNTGMQRMDPKTGKITTLPGGYGYGHGVSRGGSREQGGMVYARGGAIPDFHELLRQEQGRGDIGGESARDRAAKRYNQASRNVTSSAYSDTEGFFRKAPKKSLQRSGAAAAPVKTEKTASVKKPEKKAPEKGKPDTTKSPVAEQEEEQKLLRNRPRPDEPAIPELQEDRATRFRRPPPPTATPMPNERNIPTVPYGTAGTPPGAYVHTPAGTPQPPYSGGTPAGTPTGGYVHVPAGTPTPPFSGGEPAGTPTSGYNPPNRATRTITIPRPAPPPPTDEEITQDIRSQAAEEAATRARVRSGTPKGAIIGGQFVEFGPDDQVVPGGAFISGQWVPQSQLQFARGGAIPDETDPFTSARAEEAGYTTSAPGRAGPSSARAPAPTPSRGEAPAPQPRTRQPAAADAGDDQDPVYDDVKPTRGLMDEVARALDGGVRFLTRHFGLDSNTTSAIPTPEGQADVEQGASRLARGEGAATREELQQVDDVVDPNRALSEDDRMLSRYAKMVRFYTERGRKGEAEAAAASMMQYGSERFSQLGTFAKVAYSHYLQSGDRKDLDNTMRFLEKAYKMIPDGAKVNLSLNESTGQLEGVREDLDGNEQYFQIQPDDLPGLIQQVQDKSMYWNRIWRIADKEGFKEHAADVRSRAKEERQATREETRFERNQKAKEQAAKEREANTERRFEQTQKGTQTRFEQGQGATQSRFEQQQKRLEEQFKQAHPEVDWDTIDPMLQKAEEAASALSGGDPNEPVDPKAQFAFNQAVSRLMDALPKTMDRAKWLKTYFENENWDYVMPSYQGDKPPPDHPDAKKAPDGFWYTQDKDGGWSVVTE